VTETHIFVEPYQDGITLLVKATSEVRAWGMLREDYPDANFDYRGTVDEQIPRKEGVCSL